MSGNSGGRELLRLPLYVLAYFFVGIVLAIFGGIFWILVGGFGISSPELLCFVLMPLATICGLAIAIGIFNCFRSLNKLRYVFVFWILGAVGIFIGYVQFSNLRQQALKANLTPTDYSDSVPTMYAISLIGCYVGFNLIFRWYYRRKEFAAPSPSTSSGFSKLGSLFSPRGSMPRVPYSRKGAEIPFPPTSALNRRSSSGLPCHRAIGIRRDSEKDGLCRAGGRFA